MSLTRFSVFDMLMMILLYFGLKVAELSLSGSGHLVPDGLTPHMEGELSFLASSDAYSFFEFFQHSF
jgi:hypothetical protein